jgi:hypothetical protein
MINQTITKASSNLFEVFGFSEKEAKEYQAEAMRRINKQIELKNVLGSELSNYVNDDIVRNLFSEKKLKRIKSGDYRTISFRKMIIALINLGVDLQFFVNRE